MFSLAKTRAISFTMSFDIQIKRKPGYSIFILRIRLFSYFTEKTI